MKIHFRAKCTAELVEYWNIDAPPEWPSLTPDERTRWLQENLDHADFVSHEVVGDRNRAVIDFHGS